MMNTPRGRVSAARATQTVVKRLMSWKVTIRPCHQCRFYAKTTRCSALPFQDWSQRKGISYPKLEITTFDNGLRGMRASEALVEGELIVQLPRSCALEIEPTTKAPSGVDSNAWADQPWFSKLAFMLMREKSLKGESEFAGYTMNLPEEVDLPCFWPESDIRDLKIESLVESILEQKREWERLATDVEKISPSEFDRMEFLRCLALVRSRSFSGPYIGSKLGDRIGLGALVAVLAIANVVVNGTGAIEQTLNAVLAVTTFNFLYDFLLSRRLKVYLLAPAVDLMNHSGRVTADLSYDYFSDRYSVRLDRAYEKGDQVFISYGKKSNDDLIQYFGFVEKDNPHDVVRVVGGMRQLQKIFKEVTGCKDFPDEVPDEDVLVYREGLRSEVFDELWNWLTERNYEEDLIEQILIRFCDDQLNLLEQPISSEDEARKKLIADFRTEKAKILRTCLDSTENQRI